MLGKEDTQTSFFDTEFVCSHLINKKSFYAKMHECADSIIRDNDFADIYCLDNGRPSVPPARLAKILMLQYYENLSDRQALEMVRFNIKWKYALDVPLDYEGFDRTLMVYFRARLLANKKEKFIFQKTLELAKKMGLLKGRIDQVIDSTPMLGAGAVKDTYELLRDGIRKVIHCMDNKTRSSLNLSLHTYGKKDSKPKINWERKEERQELLSSLISDVREVLSHVHPEKEDVDEELRAACTLLNKIVSQDVEKDENNQPRIKQGVAKDRIISTSDPEMRHGRKSSAGKFNGYKTHLTKDVTSDIITSIDVSTANFPDGHMAEDLIDEVKDECSITTHSLTGDSAYGSGGMRKRMRGKKITLIAKAPPVKETGRINKKEFSIDLRRGRITCPEGKSTTTCKKTTNTEGEVKTTFIFSRKVCSVCPRKPECTPARNIGRTITIGPHEKYLQIARAAQKTQEFKEIYNKRRPPIERKIAELIRHGLRKTRYRGKRRSRLQALFTASVVNLKLIFKEQSEKRQIFGTIGGIRAPA